MKKHQYIRLSVLALMIGFFNPRVSFAQGNLDESEFSINPALCFLIDSKNPTCNLVTELSTSIEQGCLLGLVFKLEKDRPTKLENIEKIQCWDRKESRPKQLELKRTRFHYLAIISISKEIDETKVIDDFISIDKIKLKQKIIRVKAASKDRRRNRSKRRVWSLF